MVPNIAVALIRDVHSQSRLRILQLLILIEVAAGEFSRYLLP